MNPLIHFQQLIHTCLVQSFICSLFHSDVCLFSMLFLCFRCRRRIFGQSSSSHIISTETGSTPDQRQTTCSLNAQRRMNMVILLITQNSWLVLQCNELNRGHPTFFLAPFSKYLVTFFDGNELFTASPSFAIGPK